MVFLVMHALRSAYQATLLAFITMSMAIIIMGSATSKCEALQVHFVKKKEHA